MVTLLSMYVSFTTVCAQSNLGQLQPNRSKLTLDLGLDITGRPNSTSQLKGVSASQPKVREQSDDSERKVRRKRDDDDELITPEKAKGRLGFPILVQM